MISKKNSKILFAILFVFAFAILFKVLFLGANKSQLKNSGGREIKTFGEHGNMKPYEWPNEKMKQDWLRKQKEEEEKWKDDD